MSRNFEVKPGTEESLATIAELTTLAEQILATGRVRASNIAFRIILFFAQNQNQPVSRVELLNALGYNGSMADIQKEFKSIFAKLAEKNFTTDIRIHILEEDRLKGTSAGRTRMLSNRVALYHIVKKA